MARPLTTMLERTLRRSPILLAVALSSGRATAQEPALAPSAPPAPAVAPTAPAAPAVAPTAAPPNPGEPGERAADASPSPNVERRPPEETTIPIFVTGGLAVVLLGIGTAFGAMSISDHSSFNAHPTTATANAGESHELIADMCFGGALTLGVASIVMALTHQGAPSQPPDVSRATFLPVVSPRGAGLVVRF